MIYASRYKSPIGNILLASDEEGLTGLWFEGQKYFANTLPDERILQETEILREAKKWLDLYFTGEEPPFTPPLHPAGSTFRQAVWQLLLQIPYGQTITYGEIARRMAEVKKVPRIFLLLTEKNISVILRQIFSKNCRRVRTALFPVVVVLPCVSRM